MCRRRFIYSNLFAYALGALSCQAPCYPSNYPNYTNYSVSFTDKTNLGIKLDDPDHYLDKQKIDELTTETISCLKKIKGTLSSNELYQNDCQGEWDLEIKSCMVVKVPIWHTSDCTGEEVFSCSVPFASCAEKGFSPDSGCPCSCRAMVQDNEVLLTTPNMKLYKAYLITLLTGCGRPWYGKMLDCE